MSFSKSFSTAVWIRMPLQNRVGKGVVSIAKNWFKHRQWSLVPANRSKTVPRLQFFIFCMSVIAIQSTLVISKSKGLLKYFDISLLGKSVLDNWGKINRTTTFHKWICNLTPEIRDILKILWKREIAPKEQFLLCSTIFRYLLLVSLCLNRDLIFHFEISGYSR